MRPQRVGAYANRSTHLDPFCIRSQRVLAMYITRK